MRTRTVLLLTSMLLLLALAPWLIGSCTSRPFVPDELQLARSYYEGTREAAQDATLVAQRQEPSHRSVVPLGTVVVTSVSGPMTSTTAVETPTPVLLPILTTTVTPTMATIAPVTRVSPAQGSSSVVIVRTAVFTAPATAPITTTVVPTATAALTATVLVTPVATTKVVVVRGKATPAAPAAAPLNGSRIAGSPSRPPGLVEIVDVITEEMLTAQMQQDANDAAISDLIVQLTPDGFRAFGNIAVRPGIGRPVEMHATFVVENDSLRSKVTSIDFGGLDVTDQYASDLEGRINWGLYQLLPQRYVDSFELGNGQVTVQSQVKQ